MDPRLLNRITVPISASAYQGAADMQGILSFDGERLSLGFQTADALFGLIKSKPKELDLALASLDLIEFRHGWFWLMPYIGLQCNNFAALADVPGSASGQLQLSVRLRHRKQAAKLVDAVRFARAQALHAALDEGFEAPRSADLLRPSTPPPPIAEGLTPSTETATAKKQIED